MFFPARFLLLNSSSCFTLFPSNQLSCFLKSVPIFSLDTLCMIDLKAFNFSSTVPTIISASLSFTKAFFVSLILVGLVLSFLISFCHSEFFASLFKFDWELDHNMISTAVCSSYHSCVQKVWQITLSNDEVVNEGPVFRSLVHSVLINRCWWWLAHNIYMYIMTEDI